MDERKTFTLGGEEARLVIWGDHDTIELVEEKQTGNSRWSINFRAVVKKDDEFYEVTYSRGATEQQDEQPFEYTDAFFTEVFPKEKTIIVYE